MYDENKRIGHIVKGSLTFTFGVATIVASFGAATPFWVAAGITTGVYSSGAGLAETLSGITNNENHFQAVDNLPGSPLGAVGRAVDQLIGTKGKTELVGDITNVIIFFKTIKWNSSDEIMNAFDENAFNGMKKMAQNGDYMGFVYNLFGVTEATVDTLSKGDMERLNDLSKQVRERSRYFLEIKKERNK